MIQLRRPLAAEIHAQLSRPNLNFNYPEVGATAVPTAREAAPKRYNLDHNRFPLGKGRELFEQACSALVTWRHFDISWLELQGDSTNAGTSPDQVVATLTRVFGIWFLNPCRVVYTKLDPSRLRLWGAYRPC
ncbi:MAG: DUF1990 family protein [Anaerolineales bacterium]|nr:DUF1990 family protein [Anaerolineales bacterium]